MGVKFEFYLVFVIHCLLIIDKSEGLVCENGWHGYKDQCFYFANEAKNYDDAQWACVDKLSNLTSIIDKDESDFITGKMSELYSGSDRFWIGLRSIGINSPYQWEDGTLYNYQSLINDHTVKQLHKTCIASDKNGEWKASECSVEINSYVCKRSDKKESNETIEIIENGGCQEGWLKYVNKCYKIFADQESKTYDEAKTACIKTGKGNSLVTIHSKYEQDFLTSYVGAVNVSVWIGLKKDTMVRPHTWTDKSNVSFTNWAHGEPSNVGKSNLHSCTEMYILANRAGEWNDIECKSNLGYICQSKVDPNKPHIIPETNCKIKDSFRYRKACYYIEKQELGFGNAEAKCSALKGHLLSVMDYFEQAFLNILTRSYNKRLWIGFSDQNKTLEGLFKWTDNWPTYFTHWGSNQPSQEVLFNRCVTINAKNDNTWETENCNTKLGSICKFNDESPPNIEHVVGTCPNGWTDVGSNLCYNVNYKSLVNWDNAVQSCTKMDKNATLASFHSDHSLDVLRPYVTDSKSHLWIGLTQNNDKIYEWLDGTALDYSKWTSNKTEPLSSDNCVELFTHEMAWSKTNCGAEKGFICAAPKILIAPTVPQTVPPTVPKTIQDCGPEYSSWTYFDGYCYYVHNIMLRIGVDWFEAEENCNSIHGSLASVHSLEEQNFISNLAKKAVRSNFNVWLGMNAIGNDAAFEWSDRTLIDFTNFGNEVRIEDDKCVQMARLTGVWKVSHCYSKYGYICKRGFNDSQTSVTQPVPTLAPGNCPIGFTRIGNKCVQLFGKPNNWTTAREVCKKLGPGGELLSIHSIQEQSLITSMLYNQSDNFWIGLNEVKLRTLAWSDGSRYSYANWAPGRPVLFNYQKNKCIEVLSEGHRAGKWNDTNDCGLKKGFICQMLTEAIPSVKPPKSNCQEGFESYGSACFKLFGENNDKLSWKEAEDSCQRLEGHIASINGNFEQSYINTKLFAYKGLSKEIWLGLQDKNAKIFEWSDGWPVYYTNWGNGQPEYSNATRCGSIDVESTEWNSGDCEEQKGYICKTSNEKPPVIPDFHNGLCPLHAENWTNYGTSYCYYIEPAIQNVVKQKSWGDAASFCTQFDSELASFHSQHEIDMLIPQLKDAQKRLWIGLIQKHHGGFEWVDDSPLDYERWNDGGILERETYKCGSLRPENLKWINQPCADKQGFICRIKKQGESKTKESSPTDWKMPGGTVAVIVMFTILAVIAISGVSYYFYRKRRLGYSFTSSKLIQ